jgi:hypothetical protein
MEEKILNRCAIFILIIAFTNLCFSLTRSDVNLTTKPYVDENNFLQLELTLTDFNKNNVRRVHVLYRETRDSRFNMLEMAPQGFRYLASVDLSEMEGHVEYYFDIEYTDGMRESYPEGTPSANLMQTAVQEEVLRDERIIIISPEPGESIFTDEIVITASFPELAALIDKERTKMYLNTWDVSGYLQIFDEFLTFVPQQVPQGEHTVTLEFYDRSGSLISKTLWSFLAFQRKLPTAKAVSEWNVTGQFYSETRQEIFLNDTFNKNYTYSGLNLDATYNEWTLGGRLFVSNQEKSNRQPINRYSAYAQYSFWNNRFVKLTGGDAYPRLNRFLVSNIFVRGFYAQMYLKFFNIDVAGGNIQRAVEGRVVGVDTFGTVPDTVTAFGAYKRNILAVRASFGSRRTFQLGLLALKSKDDTSSLKFSPDVLPEENVALGTDLFVATPDQHLVLEGTFAASSYNSNIQSGTIPFEDLQEISEDLDDGDKKYYDRLADFITVNEFLVLRPNFAYEGRLRFRKYTNTLTMVYQSVDENFVSLGQPFFIRDERGILVTDDIRLARNQVYLTGGFRWFRNNLSNSKPDTTTTSNFFLTVSYYPLGNLPNVSLGFNTHKRSNGLESDKGGTVLPNDNRTNTINFSTDYGFLTGNVNHNLSLVLVNHTFNDNTPEIYNFGDNTSNIATLNLRSRFRFPLNTTVEVSLQQNDNAKGTDSELNQSFNAIGLGGAYTFRSAFSQNDAFIISTFGRFGTTSSEPIESSLKTEYDRLFLNGRLVYRFPQYGRISLNGDFIQYSGDQAFNYTDYILSARLDINF